MLIAGSCVGLFFFGWVVGGSAATISATSQPPMTYDDDDRQCKSGVIIRDSNY